MAGYDGKPGAAGFWQGWNNQSCHPDAPAGGGGLGRFRIPGSLDAGSSPLADYAALTQLRTTGGSCSADATRVLPHPRAPAARQLNVDDIRPAATAATFGVQDIPLVMREQLGWTKSAAVMDKWFTGAAREMSEEEKTGKLPASAFPSAYVDTTLFTMAWLLRFERVSKAYSRLKDILKSANAISELTKIARTLPPEASSPGTPLDVLSLHSRFQFQFVPVGYDGEMDDLYGSLGRFALYAAPLEWRVDRPKKGHAGGVFEISKIGIYMRDTFDFRSAQYLGHWNRQGIGIVVAAGLAGRLVDESEWHLDAWSPTLGTMVPINNSDFRAWRTRTGKGGDLLLFSDIVAEPIQLSIPV